MSNYGENPPPDLPEGGWQSPGEPPTHGQQPGYGEWPPGIHGQQPYQPGYYPTAPPGAPYAYAPYGIDPTTGVPWSDRTRLAAGLLSLLLPFVGICGVGRLYAGNILIGLLQLLGFWFGIISMLVLIGFVITPAVWLWAVIDGIVLLASGGRDQYGRPLRP